MTVSEPRHVLGISGGKDSAALALYMRDKVPEMEYFFCDTGRELPETYDYLAQLEVVLGKPIVKLNSDRDFDHWLWVFGGHLPSPQMRWCTKNLKIKPLENWIGDSPTFSYVGIRADEDREGYVSRKSNITPIFPFKDDGLGKPEILKILEDAGVGLPSYYKWRTRSGCFFCFFQRKYEWVMLEQEHPDLFAKAVEYEDKVNYQSQASDKPFTWSQDESLRELIARRSEIIAAHDEALAKEVAKAPNRPLSESLAALLDAEDGASGCQACHV